MGTKMNWDRVRKEKRHFTNGSASVHSEGTWGMPPVSNPIAKQIAIAVPPRLLKRNSFQQTKSFSPRPIKVLRHAKVQKLLELSARLSEAIEKNNMEAVAKLSSEIYGQSFA